MMSAFQKSFHVIFHLGIINQLISIATIVVYVYTAYEFHKVHIQYAALSIKESFHKGILGKMNNRNDIICDYYKTEPESRQCY